MSLWTTEGVQTRFLRISGWSRVLRESQQLKESTPGPRAARRPHEAETPASLIPGMPFS